MTGYRSRSSDFSKLITPLSSFTENHHDDVTDDVTRDEDDPDAGVVASW